MAGAMSGQKHKITTQGQSEEWTTRERLILASSVVLSGDQNWVSVSRSIKPISEMGPCARQRPPDFFSQKNCALHYAEMLEKVGTPKRKRTNDSSGAETPGKQIVTKLTLEHIDELKNSLKQDHIAYREMKNMIEEIKSGKYDAQLPVLWEKLKNKRRHNEEGQLKLALGTSDTEMPFPNAPLTPTTPVTPTALSAGVLKQGTPSSVAATHQRGKQQRVPKPTPRFQKYQQQLQQQRQSHTPQHHPQGGQGAEGVAMEGDPFKQDQADYFLGDGRSSISIGEHVDVEMTSTSQAGSEGATPTITQSPLQKTFGETGQSIGKQLSSRRTSSVSSNTQSPADAPVLSALLAAPSKDSKKGPDQDSLQKLDGGSSSSPTQVLGQGAQPGSPQLLASSSAQWTNQGGQLASHLPNTQFLEGKPFLGVTSSTMEGKKLDSIRERLSSGSSITAGGTPAVVAAPTLSKLLTTSTAISPNSGSCHTVTKPTVTVQHTLQTPKVSNNLPGGGGAVISVGGSEASDIQAVPHISVNPKTALNSTLPSSMAITPPPVTPPAEQKNPKRLIVNLQNMLANENMVASSENENDSTTEVVTVKRESEAAPGSSIEHPAVLELKLEASADTPTPSPRIGTRGRAPKPGRPGRPPKGARKSQRRRTKSATSTDNETELEEERDEDTKSESLDVESEKASEKTEDEEDLDFPPGEKKVESDFDEQTSIDDGLSEAGDRSQAERDDPTVSFRDLLNERGSIAGSESVPASPASQISQSDDHEAVQSQKTWKKSIMLVWRAAANHKYANVFNHPVTDDEAPGYHSIVFRPMDLSTIKKNIENGSIRTTSEFQRDMMLMFQNALMYNSADHDVYHMAGEMRDDVMDQIQSYIATQIMVQTSDRESKMLRGHKSDVFHFFL